MGHRDNAIIGFGGKSGGGQQHVPVEATDSLRSKATVRVLDLICEGEIEGLVNGAQSIFLDDTPLQNADGSFNFNGVTVDTRNGTQGQSYITGFPSVENEVSVNVKATIAAPVVRSLTNPALNAVRVRATFPRLAFQDPTNGDINGTSVQYAIDLQTNGGGYVQQVLSTIYTPGLYTTTSTSEKRSTVIGTRIRGVITNTYSVLPGTNTVFVEYKKTTDVAWSSAGVVLTFRKFVGFAQPSTTFQSVNPASYTPAAVPISFVTPELPVGLYDVRVTRTSGTTTTLTMPSIEVLVATDVITVTGKASSPYQRSYRVPLSGAGPWDIRMRRITPDSITSNLGNDIFFDGYTEIVDAKLRYPNSALVGMKVDASQFRTVPVRGYLAKLLRVKIPSNYNPTTRVYTGVWDGLFVIAWTDNPAWCYYDLLTNTRYGLGSFISAAQVDKWALYTIGKYCDELVPDGFGGMEPRFRLNVYLQTREEAFKVLNDLASVFRSMTYYAAGGVTLVQDAPTDPTYIYTPANVQDGMFEYSGSSLKTRHTVALVTWNDPNDGFKQKVEYVEDAAGIALYGVVQTEITAVGCTSRGQAHRQGLWQLFTERLENDTVTFSVGLDGVVARPGQVIKIADPAKATVRLGGRLLGATTTVLTLDAPVVLAVATAYTAYGMLPNGTVESHPVTTAAGTVSAVTVSPAFSQAPAAGAVWMLESSQVMAQSYRVLAATETAKHQFQIVGLLHHPGKYASIELGLLLEATSSTLLPPPPAKPDGLLMDSHAYAQSGTAKIRLVINWFAATGAVKYRVSYRRAENNWIVLPDTSNTTVEVDDVLQGDYDIELYALDAIDRRSAIASISGVVYEKGTPPSDVTGFSAQQSINVTLFQWTQAPDQDLSGYEIRYAPLGVTSWSDATPVTKVTKGTSVTTARIPPGSWTCMIKAVDSTGNESINAATVDTKVVSTYTIIQAGNADNGFIGTLTNFVLHPAGVLVPKSQSLANAVDWEVFDQYVYNPYTTCTYEHPEIDLGVDGLVRLHAEAISALGPGVTDGIANPQVFVDYKTAAGAYAGFQMWGVGDAQCRYFKAKVVADIPAGLLKITSFIPIADAAPTSQQSKNVAVSAGGLAVSFVAPFHAPPSVFPTVIGNTALHATLEGITATGFTAHIFNAAGTEVGGVFDWRADGV